MRGRLAIYFAAAIMPMQTGAPAIMSEMLRAMFIFLPLASQNAPAMRTEPYAIQPGTTSATPTVDAMRIPVASFATLRKVQGISWKKLKNVIYKTHNNYSIFVMFSVFSIIILQLSCKISCKKYKKKIFSHSSDVV